MLNGGVRSLGDQGGRLLVPCIQPRGKDRNTLSRTCPVLKNHKPLLAEILCPKLAPGEASSKPML